MGVHKGCFDGHTAECIAGMFLKKACPKKRVIFLQFAHGEPLPPDELIAGKNFLLCDFAFKRKQTEHLLAVTKNLLVLDHHKTAQKELETVPDENKVFDMSRSGAMITWSYFFPDVPPPLFVKYVQDRDIWTYEMPHTDQFVAWLSTVPMRSQSYTNYLKDDDLTEARISEKGGPMHELNRHYINMGIRSVGFSLIQIGSDMFMVAGLNCANIGLKSDMGNRLMIEYPYVDCASVSHHDMKSGKNRYSLRSTKTAYDCSKIAEFYGGGGHRNASGASSIGPLTIVPSPSSVIIPNAYSLIESCYCSGFEINGKTYNVIYLNHASHKPELLKYLTRSRTGDSDVDVGSYLVNKRVDIFAIFHIKTHTYFEVQLGAHLTASQLKQIEEYFEMPSKDRRMSFHYDNCATDRLI